MTDPNVYLDDTDSFVDHVRRVLGATPVVTREAAIRSAIGPVGLAVLRIQADRKVAEEAAQATEES